MTDSNETYLQDIISEYEASNIPLNVEDRLRYAMALTMFHGKAVNTPDMKRILMALALPEEKSIKQIKSRLLKLFVISDLTGQEITAELAKKFLPDIE